MFSVASGLPQIPYFYVEGDPFRDMVVHEGLIRYELKPNFLLIN